MSTAQPLPDDAILVHIGPHKTGTTAIQSTLASARSELPSYGVHYPGQKLAHHVYAKSLRQISDGWSGDASAVPDPARWSNFAASVAGMAGRVIISSEFFAQADETARKRLVNELGAERVHILVAARQPGAMAVSLWQQVLRSGYPVDLEQWLTQHFRRPDHSVAKSMWNRADTAELVRAFADTAGLDRVSVVVLDERDRRLLPETFERLCGLPAGFLADRPAPQSNRGLTAVEAMLLKQIIETLDSRLRWPEFVRMVRYGVTKRILEVRIPGPDEAKASLPAWAAEQAAVETERIIEGLRRSGVRIIGDLDSLRAPVKVDAPTASPQEIPVDLAAQAVVGAIARATRGNTTLDDTPDGLFRADRRAARTGPRGKGAGPGKGRGDRTSGLDDVPARELARVLVSRVRRRVRRSLRR